jgi:hypothetical protein
MLHRFDSSSWGSNWPWWQRSFMGLVTSESSDGCRSLFSDVDVMENSTATIRTIVVSSLQGGPNTKPFPNSLFPFGCVAYFDVGRQLQTKNCYERTPSVSFISRNLLSL